MIIHEIAGGRKLAANDEEILLEQDGTYFKNFEKDGILKPYEDWRLPAEERAADLAGRLDREQIAGLMLYSSHQMLVRDQKMFAGFFGRKLYDGKPLEESGKSASDLSDDQRQFLDEGIRHVLVAKTDDARICCEWVNNAQAYCESKPFGIPVNVSSDPRHEVKAEAEYNIGSGSDISGWPGSIGLAATFDPEVVKRFGEVMADEYRHMGITTALSPQIDLATEPRWNRFAGTFGPCRELSIDMARAYCDGAQGEDWGDGSVNTMVKHWPGGGTGEGGRDAHFAYGKYSVYPGNRFDDHKSVFTEGAFKLNGKTGKAAAVMPYYTISTCKDNVGNSYSKVIINDLLREEAGYDGVVCTDWGITGDEGQKVYDFRGKCWGMEEASVEERHMRALEAGVDQFGGNNDPRPVLKAFAMLDEKYGREAAEKRIRTSAKRLLMNIFRTGLYENPYLDVEESVKVVGNPGYVKEGFDAQVRSIVMLKNRKGLLPLKKGTKVYIPNLHDPAKKDWFGNVTPEKTYFPASRQILEKYFTITDDEDEADVGLVIMRSPVSSGYDEEKDEYVPVSLQYRPYVSTRTREHSLARGGKIENDRDRSFLNHESKTWNEKDLKAVLKTRNIVGSKPVIAVIHARSPMVMGEFENETDAIVMDFGVSDEAWCKILTGEEKPEGLLPARMPKDMDTVDAHNEDCGDDYEAYTDTEGHVYDFGFGLSFDGEIHDQRNAKYKL